MKIEKKIALLFLTLNTIVSNAQEETSNELKRNTIYLEAFGQGLFNSLTYDRLLNVDHNVKHSISSGITLIPTTETFVFGLPISYNFLIGKTAHKLEFGVGLTGLFLRENGINSVELYDDENGVAQVYTYVGHRNNFYTYFTPKIGYRFQKSDGGIFFRASFTPAIAGVNYESPIKGGYNSLLVKTGPSYFKRAAFFDNAFMPWGV